MGLLTERREDIAGKSGCDPQGTEQQRHKRFHAQGGVEEHSIICNDQDSLQSVSP
jgi:hypothetical protein